MNRILLKMWASWINFMKLDFFDAWQEFWIMICRYYLLWIQTHPLELLEVTNGCKYINIDMKSTIITMMYITKYIGESKFESYRSMKDYQETDYNDSLDTLEDIPSCNYIPFYNTYVEKYHDDPYNHVEEKVKKMYETRLL